MIEVHASVQAGMIWKSAKAKGQQREKGKGKIEPLKIFDSREYKVQSREDFGRRRQHRSRLALHFLYSATLQAE